MAEKITLTKQDRKKVWWRHQFLQGSWNYERMQNGGTPADLRNRLTRPYGG